MRSELESDVPVVMLTARTGIEDQEAAWRAGLFDYVIKPFDESRLVEAVEAALAPDRDHDAELRSKESSRGQGTRCTLSLLPADRSPA